MTNFIKVEGNDNLVRDRNTNQIINTKSEYQQYIARRKQKKLKEKFICWKDF